MWHNPDWDIDRLAGLPFERYVRLQDFIWIALFATLILNNQGRGAPEITMLVALGIAQVVESKIPALASTRGRVWWIVLNLALLYLLIGYSGSLDSPYWILLTLPVISGATALGVAGTLVISVVAAVSYLSFLIWRAAYLQYGLTDWQHWEIPPEYVSLVVVRVVFLLMAGLLANALAEDLRTETQNSRRTLRQLGEANAQLQQAEEAVRRSDRLAALGQLSAGLAHELRNPLGTIRGSAEMLARAVSAENEVAREVSGFIASEVDRANSLITRFLHFARPLELRPDTADLAQTIDRAIANVEREAPQVSIYKNYAPEIPPFRFDSELMERVVYNLILNAAQASPAGGAVTVKTRAADGAAEISVIDRGSGIDREHLNTIFNPFFTTKPAGVGLGLAIVAKIVDEHGGKISVESEAGKGSVFRVQIPML